MANPEGAPDALPAPVQDLGVDPSTLVFVE